ncbi:DUF732 domain-containing protein [Mycobacterium sp. NPDC003449]
MLSGRLTTRAIATSIGACACAAVMTVGVAPAYASPEDDRFVAIVKELGIPTNSPEEAAQVGRGICDAVERGKIEPARTVRGIIAQLMSKGVEKGKAANLMWGAVDVYCPQYRSIVGR